MTALAILLALGLACLCGAAIVHGLLAGELGLREDALLLASLGVPVGLGVTSLIHLLWLTAGAPGLPWLVLMDAAVTLGCIAWARRRQRLAAQDHPPAAITRPEIAEPRCLRARLIAAAAVVAVLLSIAAIIFQFNVNPHGSTDAWETWNMRARFLYRGGNQWTAAFDGGHQGDRPILVPLSVARLWQYAGGDSLLAPAMMSLLTGLALAGVLYGAIKRLRGSEQAAWAVLALLALPLFHDVVARECADVPLALDILGAAAALIFAARPGGRSTSWLILAGVLSGAAAATKNEGAVFFLGVALAIALPSMGRFRGDAGGVSGAASGAASGGGSGGARLRRCLVLGLAAFPFLVLVLLPKILATRSNEFLGTQTLATLVSRTLDARRHWTILSITLGRMVSPLSSLALPLMLAYPWLAGWRGEPWQRSAARRVAVALCLLALSYYVIYLITPLDLTWNLKVSVSRLLFHFWAAWVLVVFLLTPAVGMLWRAPQVQDSTLTDPAPGPPAPRGA